MPKRREFPAKVKAEAFRRSGGLCERCGAKLATGKIHYDHSVADGIGGEPTVENCAVLCLPCHADKTAREDIPAIARAKRLEARHIGAKAPSRHPLPGGRDSPLKRTINRGTVRRREDA